MLGTTIIHLPMVSIENEVFHDKANQLKYVGCVI